MFIHHANTLCVISFRLVCQPFTSHSFLKSISKNSKLPATASARPLPCAQFYSVATTARTEMPMQHRSVGVREHFSESNEMARQNLDF
jgi:hypothetical protein